MHKIAMDHFAKVILLVCFFLTNIVSVSSSLCSDMEIGCFSYKQFLATGCLNLRQ
eukprot:c54450_g1_i1 orf=69-233(-)